MADKTPTDQDAATAKQAVGTVQDCVLGVLSSLPQSGDYTAGVRSTFAGILNTLEVESSNIDARHTS